MQGLPHIETGDIFGRDSEYSRVYQALGLSILLHLIFLAFVRAPSVQPPATDELVRVRLQPAPRAENLPKQIVSPSEAPELPPPENTTRQSERDSRAEQETIRRGEPKPLTPPPPSAARQVARPKPPEAKPKPVSPIKPAERSLRLNNDALLSALATNDERAATDSESESRVNGLPRNYVPFSQSSQQRSIFDPLSGSSDFLPNIPDGEVTFLNAKANRYAVFVRRVALQVFGQLRRSSWARLSYGEIARLEKFVTVEAVLDRTGKLIKVSLSESSGSNAFDKIVKDAATAGAWDQNPPTGVIADDGFIHFVFEARTWARPGMEGLSEQRWILLGTGLL